MGMASEGCLRDNKVCADGPALNTTSVPKICRKNCCSGTFTTSTFCGGGKGCKTVTKCVGNLATELVEEASSCKSEGDKVSSSGQCCSGKSRNTPGYGRYCCFYCQGNAEMVSTELVEEASSCKKEGDKVSSSGQCCSGKSRNTPGYGRYCCFYCQGNAEMDGEMASEGEIDSEMASDAAVADALELAQDAANKLDCIGNDQKCGTKGGKNNCVSQCCSCKANPRGCYDSF